MYTMKNYTELKWNEKHNAKEKEVNVKANEVGMSQMYYVEVHSLCPP